MRLEELSSTFSRHFDGKRYFNPDGAQTRGWLDVLKWKLTSRPEPSPRFVEDVKPTKPPATVELGELRITLVNHSTILLQQSRLNILTDPMWSERASPFTWIGPRRRRAPGIRFEDLPRIDLLLISHNHYDHLDLPTLRRLSGRGCEVLAPAGLNPLLRPLNIGPIHEIDWGDSIMLAGATVHCIPAQHFSARGLFDRNRTLWCGYTIESAIGPVYFAGDSEHFAHDLAWIRERFGPPRLALLPIGAYEPRWFMSAVHMGPEEAVRAHEILGAKSSIAIHHGTFQLGDDGIDTPRKRLAQCAPDSFLTIANGESVTLAP